MIGGILEDLRHRIPLHDYLSRKISARVLIETAGSILNGPLASSFHAAIEQATNKQVKVYILSSCFIVQHS